MDAGTKVTSLAHEIKSPNGALTSSKMTFLEMSFEYSAYICHVCQLAYNNLLNNDNTNSNT